MSEDYKILEFKGIVTGTIFKLDEYHQFKADTPNASSYSESEMLFDKYGSVKSGDFKVIKVQKTYGEILKIGSEIFNSATGSNYRITRFTLRSKEIMINYNDSGAYLTIRNSSLVNYKPTQQEIAFKEPIDGYTLEQIEQVLLKALDKPEVDAIIIDFKRLKTDNNVIASEEPKKAVKGALMSDEEESWKDYGKPPEPTSLTFVDRNKYAISQPFNDQYPTWIDKAKWDALHSSSASDYDDIYAEKVKEYKTKILEKLMQPTPDIYKGKPSAKQILPFLGQDTDDFNF